MDRWHCCTGKLPDLLSGNGLLSIFRTIHSSILLEDTSSNSFVACRSFLRHLETSPNAILYIGREVDRSCLPIRPPQYRVWPPHRSIS